MVCSHEIAASTAQLVAASKVSRECPHFRHTNMSHFFWLRFYSFPLFSFPGKSRQGQHQPAAPAASVPGRHAGHSSGGGFHQVWEVPDRGYRWAPQVHWRMLFNVYVTLDSCICNLQMFQMKKNSKNMVILKKDPRKSIYFSFFVVETMDFSSMTLTQIKRQEMDAQVSSRKWRVIRTHSSAFSSGLFASMIFLTSCDLEFQSWLDFLNFQFQDLNQTIEFCFRSFHQQQNWNSWSCWAFAKLKI